MPSEVQNNKPKAVRNCFGLLTSQLNSVPLSYCKDGYRNTRQVNKVQTDSDCWERTFSWDFLQLRTVGTSRQNSYDLWHERIIDKRERKSGRGEGKRRQEGGGARRKRKRKRKEMESSVFKWVQSLWINTFSFVLGLSELSSEGVMTNVCVYVLVSLFVLGSLGPHRL